MAAADLPCLDVHLCVSAHICGHTWRPETDIWSLSLIALPFILFVCEVCVCVYDWVRMTMSTCHWPDDV